MTQISRKSVNGVEIWSLDLKVIEISKNEICNLRVQKYL